MAERHHRLWRWFEALQPKVRPLPLVEPWPRGGAKSTTAELGVAYVGQRLTRRYALYISETQDQADKHVANIATCFEALQVPRSLNVYGNSKGWRRNQLRTATGFNVEALGLDTAARGIKLDEYRPDLMIFDDFDGRHDSPRVTQKKTQTITDSILPAQGEGCAVLFIQNLIIENGIMSQLVDGRAEFLIDRVVAPVEVAARDLVTEARIDAEGKTWHVVTGGVAEWAGQDLSRIQEHINTFGLASFLRESQQEVKGADGYFFNTKAIRYCDLADVPRDAEFCRAWDLAATEGGGDFTAGVLMAHKGGVVWLIDVVHAQMGSAKVMREIGRCQEQDAKDWGRVTLRLPQDPAQAGKAQAERFKAEFDNPVIVPPTGAKATRATALQEVMDNGNLIMVHGPWNRPATEQFRLFRADEKHEFDDIVDAAADATVQLVKPPRVLRVL